MGRAKAQEQGASPANIQVCELCDELGAGAINALVDEWVIGELNAERNRYIIKRRLNDGIPYKDLETEIEQKYGVYISSKQLSRIVSRGMKTIKRHMG